MHTPLYRKALAHSLRLTLKHGWLWPLGLFAALLGQMGMAELLFKASGGLVSTQAPLFLRIPDMLRICFGVFHGVLSTSGWVWMILLIALFLALGIGFLFASVVSQGALVHIAAKSMRLTLTKKLPDVGESWHVGVKHAWRVFFLNALRKLVVVLLGVFTYFSAAFFVARGSDADLLWFVSLFLLALLVGMMLSFLLFYAVGYVVIEEYSFGKALVMAWKLFFAHPLVSFEVGLLVLFTNVIVALLALVGMLLLFFPAMLFWLLAVATGSTLPFAIAFFFGVIASTLLCLLLGSIFTVFTTSVWTYLFMHMHKKGIVSRFLHLFRTRD